MGIRRLLPNTEVAENVIQNIVCVDIAQNGAQFLQGRADLHGDKLVAMIRGRCGQSMLQTLGRSIQAVATSHCRGAEQFAA